MLPHNVDRALPTRSYQYVAYGKDGTKYAVHKPLRHNLVWSAYVLEYDKNKSYTFRADTLKELATKIYGE